MPEPLDPFDATLKQRIGAAESRVRVSSPAPGRLPSSGPTRWLRHALMLATTAAAVVLAVVVFGQLPERSTGDASPSTSVDGGVSDSARNGDFVLTLSSPRSTWTTEDDVQVTARLSYDGDEPEVEIGGGSGPVVFSLSQLESGDTTLEGGQHLPCLRYPLAPETPLVWTFQKTGVIGDEQPFDRAFFEDPELHLPPGRWEARAVLQYGIGECGDLRLEVAIEFDVVDVATSSPSAVDNEPGSPAPTDRPSSPTHPTTALRWTATGSFPAVGPSMVDQVVMWGDKLVATGVAYDHGLPTAGPSPQHVALVWLSPDGRHWEEVALGAGFRNARLGHVFIRPDGSLLAIGHRYQPSPSGELGVPDPAAWESTDGRSWTPAALPLPGLASHIVHGEAGFLAVVRPNARSNSGDALWHSSDGEEWDEVHRMRDGESVLAADAGVEGFVVAGRNADEMVVLASGDGRSWFRAAGLPTGVFQQIAAIEGDWLAIRTSTSSSEGNGEAWFSEDGLDWSRHGTAELAEVTLDEGSSCVEYPHYLSSAGSWLVMGTTLSYGCSEGGWVVHGAGQISADGSNWTRLPFKEGTPGESRSGTAVNASATMDGNLVLAGEQDGIATFWIGEPR